MNERLDKMSEKLIINQNIIIFFSSIICYFHSISGDFVFDDTEAIVNNNDVIGETNLKDVFRNDFWGTKLVHNSSHKSYRPLTILTFRLLKHLSFYMTSKKLLKSSQTSESLLNPKLYHLLNIVLYGFLCLLLLKTLNKLLSIFDCIEKSNQTLNKSSNNDINYLTINNKTAFLVTLLFSVHPIHSESVSLQSCDSFIGS
jgi:hypothetical protein